MKTLILILIGLIIMAFPGCDCGGGGKSVKGVDYDIPKDTLYVPPVPEEETDAEAAPAFGKGRKPKWNYPAPIDQPPTTGTATSGTGIPCVYVHFEGGVMDHFYWLKGGSPVTLGNSGLTVEQKAQALAVAQSYFAPYKIIVTDDVNIYNQSGIRVKTWVTATAWYMGDVYGGISVTGSLWYFQDYPNFVYTSKLNFHPRYTGQMIVHEAGHSLGLGHKYNSSGGLLSCAVMGNPLECNPASWQGDENYLVQKLGYK